MFNLGSSVGETSTLFPLFLSPQVAILLPLYNSSITVSLPPTKHVFSALPNSSFINLTKRAKMNEKILDYDGIIIRRSDRRILESGDYLNNRFIELYFRYLFHTYGTEDILLIPPSVSSLLTNTSSDNRCFKDSIERLKLDQRKLIFFPINDNDDITSEGEERSHWSLLVYCRTMHSFVHHDSLGGINDLQARKLYGNVKDFVGYGGSTKSRRISSKRCKSEACFTECFTPQQKNVYDSSLYVMVFAHTICEWFISWSVTKSLFWLSALERRVDNSYVELNMRADVLELLDTLKEGGYDSF